MDSPGAVALCVALYLLSGAVAYRRTFPLGLFPEQPDPETERLRRTCRRRVLPLPDREARR